MHSEGILSGELKHGPLALVDENMPCVIVVVKDNTYTKCHNALQQVTYQLLFLNNSRNIHERRFIR